VVRNLLALIAGLVAGMGVNMALVSLNAYVLFPMPEGTAMPMSAEVSLEDMAQFQEYISGLPTTAFLVVLAAHIGQSFVGGWVAARLGSSRPMLLAMTVGVISLAGGIMNMMTIKGPTWMYIELPLYLVVAWLAGRMEIRRQASAG